MINNERDCILLRAYLWLYLGRSNTENTECLGLKCKLPRYSFEFAFINNKSMSPDSVVPALITVQYIILVQVKHWTLIDGWSRKNRKVCNESLIMVHVLVLNILSKKSSVISFFFKKIMLWNMIGPTCKNMNTSVVNFPYQWKKKCSSSARTSTAMLAHFFRSEVSFELRSWKKFFTIPVIVRPVM